MTDKMPQDRSSEATSADRPVYIMYPQEDGDSINLVDVFFVLWRHKFLIVAIAMLFGAAGVVVALMAEPVYRAEVILAPNQPEQGPTVPSGLGGVASLVGIDIGTSADGALNLATLRSRAFAEAFITDNGLLPILFADKWDAANGRWMVDDPAMTPEMRDAVALFSQKIRSVTENSSTGLITLAVEWVDPDQAAAWANELVIRINERLRARDLEDSRQRLSVLNRLLDDTVRVELRQAIARLIEVEYQTIMLAEVETEYAFRVIDPAIVPKERIAPKRTLIVIVATLLGGLVGVFVILLVRSVTESRRARQH